MLLNENLVDSFTEWAERVEPQLRHALTASFGSQVGRDVTADALAHAWVHWGVVSANDNRLGYVYAVGRLVVDDPLGEPDALELAIGLLEDLRSFSSASHGGWSSTRTAPVRRMD